MTKRMIMTTKIYNDAGLLREYCTQRYGSTLTYGSYGSIRMSDAIRNCRRLAEMTGLSLQEVIETIQDDHRAAEAREDA